MIAYAALSSAALAFLVMVAVLLIALPGVWLLASGSARRTLLVARGGVELERRRSVTARLDARLIRTRRGAALSGRLRSAGSELTVSRFIAVAAGAVAVAVALGSLLFPTVIAAFAGVVALWGCFSWLDRRLDKRREQFLAQLPEVARLLSNGASAGLAMPTAIELAVRELEAPASLELQTVIDELRLGRALEDCLEDLQRRLPSREIAVLMTTVIVQQRTGGDAVRALQELSSTLESRRDTRREIHTLMAGTLFISYLVPVLGLLALLLLDTINSKTLERMTSTPAGIAVLVVSGSLYALGTLAIRRTARVDL